MTPEQVKELVERLISLNHVSLGAMQKAGFADAVSALTLLAQEREELRHDIDRHIKITAEQATENEELRKALRKIAGKTYGTEINDSDADRADIYWQHITRFQSIARAALKES